MTIGPGTILTPFWACTIVLNAYATGDTFLAAIDDEKY